MSTMAVICYCLLVCLTAVVARSVPENKGSTAKPKIHWTRLPVTPIMPTVQWTRSPSTPWVRIYVTGWAKPKVQWTRSPATPWVRINVTKWAKKPKVPWVRYPSTPWVRIKPTRWPSRRTRYQLNTEPTEPTTPYNPDFVPFYANSVEKTFKRIGIDKTERLEEIDQQNKIIYILYKNDNTVIIVLIIGVAACIVSMLFTMIGVYCILNRQSNRKKIYETRAASLPWRTLHHKETV